VENAVFQANKRLKESGSRVKLLLRGKRVSLRAWLPPKEEGGQWSQQTIAIKKASTLEGVRDAEKLAHAVQLALDRERFNWEDWGYIPVVKGNASALVAAFKADRFAKIAETPKSLSTWRTDYDCVFRRLPDKPLSQSTILAVVESTKPNSRTRLKVCRSLAQLAKFAGLKIDLAPYRGDYSPAKVDPRDIPSDQDIIDIWRGIDSPEWAWAFGMMATYGLRNHELYHVDLDLLASSEVVELTDTLDGGGKTGARTVWPFYPEWYHQFRLSECRLPLTTCIGNKALGSRITKGLERHGFIHPYRLRHAWAIRTLLFGFPLGLAAQQMGHGEALHCDTYHRWIKREHHRLAYERIMQHPQRPRPPEVNLYLAGSSPLRPPHGRSAPEFRQLELRLQREYQRESSRRRSDACRDRG
jgi:integrase